MVSVVSKAARCVIFAVPRSSRRSVQQVLPTFEEELQRGGYRVRVYRATVRMWSKGQSQANRGAQPHQY